MASGAWFNTLQPQDIEKRASDAHMKLLFHHGNQGRQILKQSVIQLYQQQKKPEEPSVFFQILFHETDQGFLLVLVRLHL